MYETLTSVSLQAENFTQNLYPASHTNRSIWVLGAQILLNYHHAFFPSINFLCTTVQDYKENVHVWEPLVDIIMVVFRLLKVT